jgi:AmiR/NasT family two-component response regulator
MSVRVLVVEDEAILAIDIAEQLTEAGFLVVGPAPSVARALKLIVEVGCDVALLDMNLRGAHSARVTFAAHSVPVPVRRLQRAPAARVQRRNAIAQAYPSSGPHRRSAKLDCRSIA